MTEAYNMSFSTGGLFLAESVRVAELFQRLGDWAWVREKVLSENLLQTRTVSSATRICREVIHRLKTLEPAELDLLVHGAPKDRGYLLWVAVCRHHRFVAEFAAEVLRRRFVGLGNELHYEDFDSFFFEKSSVHPELETIRPVTRKKLRQVLFKMLREADLLSAGNIIRAAIFTPRFREALSPERPDDLFVFPWLESPMEETEP